MQTLREVETSRRLPAVRHVQGGPPLDVQRMLVGEAAAAEPEGLEGSDYPTPSARAEVAGMVNTTLSEKEFTGQVIQLATLQGWHVHHCRPARMKDGRWATAISGHAGFPDLVLARQGRVIFAELKSEKGRTTLEQDEWLYALEGRVEEYVWRPSDFDEIQKVLTR